MRTLTFALSLAFLAGAYALPAQQHTPGVCLGVDIGAERRCAAFFIIEGGGRVRLTGQTDHSTRDRTHAYPILQNHGFLASGVAWPVGNRAALGVVGEIGGGDARQGIGVRYDRALVGRLRLDLTAGGMRVETHQAGVTRRRMTSGPFADATLHVHDLFAIQARGERFAGDGGLVKPASALCVGGRLEGKPGLGAAGTFLVLASIFLVYAFFTSSE
ncbi:MAG TPA: hypothetical protein VF761_04005 [Gemmatimonadaceae bacterium]